MYPSKSILSQRNKVKFFHNNKKGINNFLIFLRCWPVLTPHSCGTCVPPVTRKKSVVHSPLAFGGARSKRSRSRRIWGNVMCCGFRFGRLKCYFGWLREYVCRITTTNIHQKTFYGLKKELRSKRI